MIEAIFNFLNTILQIFKEYKENKQQRQNEKNWKYKNDVSEFDEALANTDTDTMSIMFNKLWKPTTRYTRRQDDTETP